MALALVATASAAAADTLLMPNRDFLAGTSEVVWGVTTQANGTAFTLDYGDGSAATTGTVTDRSYIAFNHTYALANTYTITLTVGAESATTTVRVFNGGTLSAADLRSLNINRTIQDGLRYLWFAQSNRAGNFPASVQTNWGQFSGDVGSFTSLVVLAFENQGYRLPNNDTAPTGIYERFVVQRGFNFILNDLFQQSLNVQTAGDPCVGGVGAAPCTGLYLNEDPGYATAIASLPFSGSTALSRHVAAGIGANNSNFVAGRTYGEVLQRLIDTVAWGQNDGTCIGRGGWIYSFSNGFCQQSDGSTVGWDILSLLDAAAAGSTIPTFVKSEFQTFAFRQGLNTDGTFDYRADSAPGTDNLANAARAGTALQGLFYVGAPDDTAAATNASVNAISTRWSGVPLGGDYTATCNGPGENKGCSYAMFNIFKGLKLQGINSIPAASDWYGEYQDWLVQNQSNQTSTTGGNWVGGTGKTAMQWSCCASDQTADAAIAELILSPVALITPDPDKFATVGLSPATATNPIGSSHTVTATAQSASGAPVPGVTITFQVMSGPNTGKTGSGTTNASGQTTFTYSDTGGGGTDTIQAFIGTLGSNVVSKTWVNPTTVCDVDGNGVVNATDLNLIRAKNGQKASGPNDPYDPNHDGVINVADVRFCQLRVTPRD